MRRRPGKGNGRLRQAAPGTVETRLQPADSSVESVKYGFDGCLPGAASSIAGSAQAALMWLPTGRSRHGRGIIHAWCGSTASVEHGSTLQKPVSPPRRCTWRCRTYAAPGASPVRTGRSPTPTDPDRGRTPAGAGRHPHTCRTQAASDTFTSRRARTAAARRSRTCTVVSQSMQPSVMLWP